MISKEVDRETRLHEKRTKFADWQVILLRICIGTLFILASLSKVFTLDSFAGTLHQYAFLPDWSIPHLTLLIPALEYGLGACLLLGLFLRHAISILLGIIVVFSSALLYQLLMGNSGSCGCFGGLLPEPNGWWTLVRNGVLMLLNAILLLKISEPKRKKCQYLK